MAKFDVAGLLQNKIIKRSAGGEEIGFLPLSYLKIDQPVYKTAALRFQPTSCWTYEFCSIIDSEYVILTVFDDWLKRGTSVVFISEWTGLRTT